MLVDSFGLQRTRPHYLDVLVWAMILGGIVLFEMVSLMKFSLEGHFETTYCLAVLVSSDAWSILARLSLLCRVNCSLEL